jgi:hypothetical protein
MTPPWHGAAVTAVTGQGAMDGATACGGAKPEEWAHGFGRDMARKRRTGSIYHGVLVGFYCSILLGCHWFDAKIRGKTNSH